MCCYWMDIWYINYVADILFTSVSFFKMPRILLRSVQTFETLTQYEKMVSRYITSKRIIHRLWNIKSNGLLPTDSTFIAKQVVSQQLPFIDPAIGLSMFCCHSCLWYHVFYLSGIKFVWVFFYRFILYMRCRWRSSYQEERVGISFTSSTPPHFCACPRPSPRFPTSYLSSLLCVFSEWRFVLLILVELLTIIV